jgi:hypothetical protein
MQATNLKFCVLHPKLLFEISLNSCTFVHLTFYKNNEYGKEN